MKFKELFFNFISSIRSKNTFRTNRNLFDFKKPTFLPFSNEILEVKKVPEILCATETEINCRKEDVFYMTPKDKTNDIIHIV